MLGGLSDDWLTSGNKLSAIIRANKIYQITDRHTRVTPQSATLLDILIINKQHTIIHKNVIPSTIADHDQITATINITKPKRLPVTRTSRYLGAYSKDSLCNALLTAEPALTSIPLTDDGDAQVDILTSVFTSCLDHCAPVVTTIVNKSFAPWLNDEIRSAMATRNNLQSRLKQDRRNAALQEQKKKYKRNRVSSMLRNAEQALYHEQFHNCKGNTAATWKIIRNMVPNNNNNNNNKKLASNNNIENELEQAEKSNERFVNVGKLAFDRTQNELNIVHPHRVSLQQNLNYENFFRPNSS